MQLFIDTRGTSLLRKGERFVIRRRHTTQPIEISSHRVQSLVIARGVQISRQLTSIMTAGKGKGVAGSGGYPRQQGLADRKWL